MDLVGLDQNLWHEFVGCYVGGEREDTSPAAVQVVEQAGTIVDIRLDLVQKDAVVVDAVKVKVLCRS